MTTSTDTAVSIDKPCVCLTVELNVFGVTRRIPSERVTTTAKRHMVRASKRLFESDRYKAIKRLDADAYAYVARHALPSPMRGGTYLLPVAMVQDVEQRLQQYADERTALVEEFVKEYPELRILAKTILGDLYSDTDYPPEEVVRDRFSFRWRYVTFDTPAALAHIDAELYETALKKNEQAMAETAALIRQTLRATAHELVAHMAERLTPDATGDRKVFRDSLVGNMVEFLSTFDLRDVTDDVELQNACSKMRKMLQGVDPRILRDDESARKSVLKTATAICKQLDVLRVSQPIRLITDED